MIAAIPVWLWIVLGATLLFLLTLVVVWTVSFVRQAKLLVEHAGEARERIRRAAADVTAEAGRAQARVERISEARDRRGRRGRRV